MVLFNMQWLPSDESYWLQTKVSKETKGGLKLAGKIPGKKRALPKEKQHVPHLDFLWKLKSIFLWMNAENWKTQIIPLIHEEI